MDSDVLVHDRAPSPSRLSATLPSHVECVHRNVGACACAPFVMSQHLSLGPPLVNQKREEDVGCVGIGPVPGARVLDDRGVTNRGHRVRPAHPTDAPSAGSSCGWCRALGARMCSETQLLVIPGAGPRCALTPVRRPVLEGRTLREMWISVRATLFANG